MKVNFLKYLRTLILACCLFSLPISLLAQTFKNSFSLTGSDLPFREVLSSYEDENKYLWLLVTNELCRVSGNDKDCFEIPIKETNDLFRVGKRYLIVHNKNTNGAIYFDTKTNTFSKFFFPPTSKIYKNIKEEENLFYYDKGVIYRYDFIVNKGIVYKSLDYKFIDVKNKLFKAPNGDFIATELGTLWINNKKIKVPKGESFSFQQIFDTEINYIYNDGKTISKIDKKSHSISQVYTDSLICKTIWQDDKENFILSLHKVNLCQIINKILFFDKNWTPIDNPLIGESIENKNFAAQIQSTDFTKEWNVSVWNGFKKYSYVNNIAQRKLYEPLNGRPFNHVVTDMTIDNDGNIYIIAEEEKIFKLYNDGKVDTFNIKVFIKDKVKKMGLGKAIIYDEVKDLIYAGCGEYNTQHSSIVQMDKSGKNPTTICSLEDRIWDFYKYGRKLLIASTRNKIFSYDLDQLRLDTLVLMDNKDMHMKTIMLSQNTLYVGSREGLYTYNLSNKKQEKIDQLDGININTISKHEDKIYLSTMSGIYQLDLNNKIIARYTIKNGLPDDDVKGVVFFTKNEALVPTSKGVGKINIDNKLCYTYNNSKIELSDDENNSMAHYQYKNNIYLGTINGIDIFDTKKLLAKNKLIPFISKAITYNNNRKENIEYNVNNTIQFHPNDLKCMIFFGSILNSKNVSYAVKKLGIDEDWTFISGQSLELLRPKSDMKLLVKCTNEYGVWSEDQKIIEVKCSEHFYNNPLFYIMLTALISGLIYFFSKKRENEIKRNAALIQDMEGRMAQSKLESLQAQMNPHFLFNAMASIQFLLNSNQTKKAEQMLTSFSRLIRKTLESSVKLVWTLEEEIAMLNLYCDIEKERFEIDSISINIDTGNIDLEEVHIPPMLIQPFVENAFKHAFTNVKKGKLDILFEEKNDTLNIEIRDNGTGFDESRGSLTEERKGPRGMLITQDRIALYSKKIGKKIEFQVVERKGSGLEGGTSIFISIPI